MNCLVGEVGSVHKGGVGLMVHAAHLWKRADGHRCCSVSGVGV